MSTTVFNSTQITDGVGGVVLSGLEVLHQASGTVREKHLDSLLPYSYKIYDQGVCHVLALLQALCCR